MGLVVLGACSDDGGTAQEPVDIPSNGDESGSSAASSTDSEPPTTSGQPATTVAEIPEVRFDGSLVSLLERDGCGWAFFYAIDGGDTVLLTAEASGLFEAIRDEPGTILDREIALPSPELTVLVEEGPSVRGLTCTDASSPKQIERSWEVTAGSAHLRISVADLYWESTGDLELSDVEMQSTDGLTVAVDDISWADIPVGTEQP